MRALIVIAAVVVSCSPAVCTFGPTFIEPETVNATVGAAIDQTLPLSLDGGSSTFRSFSLPGCQRA